MTWSQCSPWRIDHFTNAHLLRPETLIILHAAPFLFCQCGDRDSHSLSLSSVTVSVPSVRRHYSLRKVVLVSIPLTSIAGCPFFSTHTPQGPPNSVTVRSPTSVPSIRKTGLINAVTCSASP